MMLDSRDLRDMRQLAAKVEGIPPQSRPLFAAAISSLDIMRCQWWIRALVKIGSFIHGDDLFDRYALIFLRLPAVADRLVAGLARHIVYGRDLYEAGSAGGLCSTEVQNVERLVRLATSVTQ